MNPALLCVSNSNENSSPALGEKNRLLIARVNLKRMPLQFFLTMFLPDAEKRIAKLVSLRDSVIRFRCLYFICACHYQLPSLSQLEYLTFMTFFVLSTEDQETRKRIGLNSHCCP